MDLYPYKGESQEVIMIKSFTAFTDEIDDAGQAVAEITQQLEEAGALLKNTFGIISCYAEFVESGVVSALC